MLKRTKVNYNVEELQDRTMAGYDPIKGIVTCTDGEYLWNEDIMHYVPLAKLSLDNYNYQHSTRINILPLKFDTTIDGLMIATIDAGGLPIRHTICQCTDGDFIWDEESYSYKPFISA